MQRAGKKTVRFPARLLNSVAWAIAEQLEQRQLLNAQVVPPSTVAFTPTAPLAPTPGATFWINGLTGSSAWSFNSIITPNTVNDLVLNVTPFSQTYTGCCEGTNAPPGNTSSVNAARLLTNGLTQNQVGNFPSRGQVAATGSGAISDAASGASVVSENGGGQWWMEYNLGAWPGGNPSDTGYDISEIDVISGHQDYRTGISVDIEVQFQNGNTTDWFTLSNGANFSFTSDPTQSHQVSRGAAQMAIVNGVPGPMASFVRAVKFLAVNQQTWFREFVVTGTVTLGEPHFSPPPSVTATLDQSNPGDIDVSFPLGQGNFTPTPYLIQRAMVTNGVIGAFTTVGTRVTQISPVTFVDTAALAGTVYVYRVVNADVLMTTSPLSNFITTTAISVEAHFYNQAFWSGPVAATAGLSLASIDSPTGAWPGTSNSQDSLVITGKVTTNQSGVYTFISNTDDDGYLYVDGVLVSSDPGGHGVRNAGLTFDPNATPLGTFHPILLQANTSYDFVLMEHNHDAGAGAHFMWVTPTAQNGSANSIAPVVVPSTNLQPVSDPPATPTNLNAVTINSNFVNFTFTAENRGVVQYLLQRQEVTAGTIDQPWVTVGENYPASDKTAVNSAGVITGVTPVQVTIQDAMPIAGSTYIYRVAAMNYDGTVLSPETPATVVTAADLASPPTPGMTLSTAADAAGLSPGTYFLSYAWSNSSYLLDGKNRGQTAGSAEQTIVLTTPADILAALPAAPPGAINANVYLSTATAAEKLVGSVNGGQTLTINSLPPTAAKAVPTTNTAGLAPGTYFVAYTWVGDNLNATGETQDQAIDNSSRLNVSDETAIVLSATGDLLISGFPQVPASAQNVNVYVGTASGQETLVATIAPTATLTLNTLSTPTSVPLPASNTTAALSPPTSPVAIPPQSTDPPGVEIRMYNGVLTDTQLATQYVVPMNGLPAEYVPQATNQSPGTFFPGVIDRMYDFSRSDGIIRVSQAPDSTPFPDIPRVEWDEFSQAFTGSIQVGVSGVYTIVSNTDDSGFVWVNDMLVSADPGVHIERDTTTTQTGDTLVPITLLPGQSYDLTMTMTLRADDGDAGAHLKWIEPAVNTGNVASATNNNGFNFAAVTLNSATLPAYDLKGFTLFITNGRGSGQQAVIENWNSSTDEAVVQVTTNGSSFLWSTVPDSTSQYTVAWQEIIPLANGGNNGNPTPGAGSDGFLMRQDAPVESVFNPSTGAVGIISSGSAAGNLAITSIDPRAGVTLTWTDQSNSELWFEVQRSTDGTNWTTVGKAPFDVGTSFTDTTAGNAFGSPTISYFYRVRGVNFDGAGPFTSIVNTTGGLVVSPPTITAMVQGSPGTAGLIFNNAPASAVDTGGLDIQYAPVTSGSTGAFVDATPVPLPFNTFDYQVTGLAANQQYVFEARYSTSVNNSNPNLFSAPVAFTPSGGASESFGSPGTGVAGFPARGPANDLLLNGNTSLTGSGIPSVPTPTTGPTTGTPVDISNPSAPMGSTVNADVPQPTAAGTATTSANNLALTQSTTFFLEYTWVTSSGTETLPGPATRVAGPSNGSNFQVTFQVPSSAPVGVVNANVYIAADTSSSASEVLAGTINPGSTIKIQSFPASTQHPPAASNTGLLPGTYFVEYTFLNSTSQETAPSPEQTVTLTNLSNDLILSLPSFPSTTPASTVTSANVYIGTASGAEQLAGNVSTSGGALTIKNLPASSAATPPTVSNVGLPVATYFVSYTWQSSESNLGDSAESPDTSATTQVIGSADTDLSLIIPATPAGVSATNIYVGVPVANPTAPLTLGQTTGGSLSVGTYYLRYEWFGSGVTLPGAEQTFGLTGAYNRINVVPPGNPFGAAGVRIFVGTAPGAESLVGAVSGGGTFSINSLPSGAQGVDTVNTTGQYPIRVTTVGASTAAQTLILRSFNTSGSFAPPAAPTTVATLSLAPGTPGLSAGTYFLDYTWTSSTGYETTSSPEQTIVIPAGSTADLQVTVGPSPFGAGPANVYLGTASGRELIVGTTSGGMNTLTIAALPDINQKPVPTATSPVARYFTPANALQLTSNAASQSGSAFNLGEDIAGFVTSFDFQLTGNMNPQGFGFVLQDLAQNALPAGNFSSGIGPSVGIFFNPNVATTGGNSTGLSIDGAAPSWIDMTQMNGRPTGIVLGSANPFDQRAGDIYNVILTYDINTHLLTETVKDLTMFARGFNAVFTTTYSIDIVATLGMPAAYLGFVGASGSGAGEQDILNWNFGASEPPPLPDVINGTNGIDQITLRQDPDHQHIDWNLNGGPIFTLPIDDPNGLTINGNGGNDVLTLDYSNGNPLPASLHLNGVFFLNGLQGTNPLAGTLLDINRSTVFISYSSSDPIAAIQSYLKNGYNNGAWNGVPAAGSGVITSLAAQSSAKRNTAIGYADFADGQGVDTIPNTIELKYTLNGDANLDTSVNSADLQILLFNLNHPGSWDQGDFNYDGQVNSADLQSLLFTLNTSLGSQATPMAVAATPAVTTATRETKPKSDPPTSHMPALMPTGSTTAVNQRNTVKPVTKKRH